MAAISLEKYNEEIKELERVLTQLEIENEKTQSSLTEKNELLAAMKEKVSIMEVTMKEIGDDVKEIIDDTMREANLI